MNEDEHKNMIIRWPELIFKADNTHDEEKDTIGKENIAGGNTVTDHCERERAEHGKEYEHEQFTCGSTKPQKGKKRELLVNVNKIQNLKTISF